ncbi:MAG TPA: isoaspartyl peptidase/L-asparaginase [Acidimicrobiales bacterium]|jgi:isoaspartyl peptidase/L-asparaginase-like protein (Ntn-hydrolase superfamily)|nr:isoaspartyl peptidase/L-asparaginase [Acidimicrobiales bacterium]
MAPNVRLDSGPVTWPAIVVHGGAGTYERLSPDTTGARELEAALQAAIGAALDAGWSVLEGGDPVGAVVAAVEFLEHHGGFNAGRGSVPNTDGDIEMDAAVMDDAGRAGAVACMGAYSPIRSAEAVMHVDGPLLLAGPNADAFAARAGVTRLEPASRSAARVADPAAFGEALSEKGTVGAVAVSGDGRFAAASSTGGRPGQLPGRVGDTPIPGAGLWAQPRCAVSATGAGEAFVLAGFSRLVGSRLVAGEDPSSALHAGLDAVNRYGGTGGSIVLGSDRTWAAAYSTAAMARGVRHRAGRYATCLD